MEWKDCTWLRTPTELRKDRNKTFFDHDIVFMLSYILIGGCSGSLGLNDQDMCNKTISVRTAAPS